MRPYSSLINIELTRSGVYVAAYQGRDCLSKYLEAVSPPSGFDTCFCLRTILCEQFSRHSTEIRNWTRRSTTGQSSLRDIDIRVSKTLIECGISHNEHSSYGAFELAMQTAVLRGRCDSLTFLLDRMIREGAIIDGDNIQHCIARTGSDVLEFLFQQDSEIEDHREIGLLFAARKSNYDAVCLFLQMGADINGEVNLMDMSLKHRRGTILSHLMTDSIDNLEHLEARKEMWAFFINQAAKVRLLRGDTTCYQLMKELIGKNASGKLGYEAFKFILYNCVEDLELLKPSRWQRLSDQLLAHGNYDAKILEAISRKGARISGPVLAIAIEQGSDLQHVEWLLAAGQGINDCSRGLTPLQAAVQRMDPALVSRLIQLGAKDKNDPKKGRALLIACIAAGKSPMSLDQQRLVVKLLLDHDADDNAESRHRRVSTALRVLCAHSSNTKEKSDRLRQLMICLIEYGADVNASPGVRHGAMTALQHCAQNGDLGKAVILIQHGVDPNGYPCGRDAQSLRKEPDFASAIDLAAEAGRLDLTQYLLNVGAFSAQPGATGYEGAIDSATRHRHHAVAEIVRNHANKVAERKRVD